MIAPAIIGGVAALGKMGLGAAQVARANKARRQLQDPGAQVTEAELTNTAVARNLAATAFVDPREVEATRGRTSDILAEATRRGSGIDNVAEAFRMEQADQSQRFSRAANEFYTNNARYMMALQGLSREQARVQQYNQGRFAQDLAATGALATAGQNNIIGGLDSAGAAALSAFGRTGAEGVGAEGATGSAPAPMIFPPMRTAEQAIPMPRTMPSQSTTAGNATTVQGVDPMMAAISFYTNYFKKGAQGLGKYRTAHDFTQ